MGDKPAYNYLRRVCKNKLMEKLLTILIFLSVESFGQTNKAPKADAGADTIINYPMSNYFYREGKGTDTDGTITSYKWDLYSTNLLGQTNVKLLTIPYDSVVYTYRLIVTDNKGAKGYDYVNITYRFNPFAVLQTIQIGNAGVLNILNNGEYVISGIPDTTRLPLFVNVSECNSDGGYGYYLVQDFYTASDNMNDMNKSTLKIFENGAELQPAHSLHADIRSLGGGRFSHWDNGLYFSASDNSNPKTNGKIYTYKIQ